MPIEEGTCKEKAGQDDNSLLTASDVQERFGVSAGQLESFRGEGCPKKRCGKEWRYPATFFKLWVEHRSLDGVDSIGVREVVLSDKGQVLGIVDLTSRWFPTCVLLLLGMMGCSTVPSVSDGQDRVHRTIEAGVTATTDSSTWVEAGSQPAFEVNVKAVWEIQ